MRPSAPSATSALTRAGTSAPIVSPIDSDAYNSVGGFVFGELGRLPKRGDTVTHNGYSIRVESVRENRIEAVRIRQHGETPEPGSKKLPV